jgi:phosphotransferase system HPr-like phosphotransfer protein
MAKLVIELKPAGPGWVVQHPDQDDVVYQSKEAALESAIAVIQIAIAEGRAVELAIPEGSGD